MTFDADTGHFILETSSTEEDGAYGFHKGTREDVWMTITEHAIRSKFSLQDPNASKAEKVQNEQRVKLMMSKAYDFMFWCIEHDIDFFPAEMPSTPIYVQAKVGEDKQIFSYNLRLQSFPIDDALRRLELGGSKIAVALGPLMPVGFSEDDEPVSWTILAGPIRSSDINQYIQIQEAQKKREEEIADRRAQYPGRVLDVMEGVSMVTDSEWIRTHEGQFGRIQQENMFTTIQNLNTVVSH